MAVERFTYAGDPAAGPIHAVRFFAGDTDRDAAELDDREIAYALTLKDNPRLCAADLLDALSAKYARKATFKAGEISKNLSDVAKSLSDRATKLRNNAGVLSTPFFGGRTHSGKEDLDARTDDVQPMVRRGQFDSPLVHQFDDDGRDPSDPNQVP